MAVYRWVKKHIGLISLWIASLILVFNYSAYRNESKLKNSSKLLKSDINQNQNENSNIIPSSISNSQNVPNSKPIPDFIYKEDIQYDDLGNQIHPNLFKLPDGSVYKYNHTTPIIFIGGMPRSGTTLMRVMLDAHSDVRCGEETRLVPRLLGMRSNWYRSDKEKKRLNEAGVTDVVIDEAIRQFLLEVIVRHGIPNKYLCNKDPFTLKSQIYLKKLFPNAKFLLMIRDGRATSHSIIERKVTISGFDITSYRDVLTKWNKAIETMYQQCIDTPDTCLPVYYEQLVLHPESNLRKIAKFLNIGWDEKMLHHEDFVNKMSISQVEKSTSQVQKPLYLDALSAWWGHIPDDVEDDLSKIAPMLGKMGYKYHYTDKPTYGVPDKSVLDNIKKNEFLHEWKDLDPHVENIDNPTKE